MKRFSQIVGVVALSLVLFALGCGGSSDSSESSGTPSGVITRSSENEFSKDAKVLASREATDAWLSTELASRFDRDLAAIREDYGELADIHTFPEYDLNSVLVAVRTGTDWVAHWQDGEIMTGEAELDAVLEEYGPSSVESRPLLETAERTWFVLKFVQSLNQQELAKKLKEASEDIVLAEPNLYSGDGDNITCELLENGSRRYTLSRGWGDCTAGCIYEHHWIFLVTEDGTVTFEGEDGVPLGTGAE